MSLDVSKSRAHTGKLCRPVVGFISIVQSRTMYLRYKQKNGIELQFQLLPVPYRY